MKKENLSVMLLENTVGSHFKTHHISIGANYWLEIYDGEEMVSLKFMNERTGDGKEIYTYIEADKESKFWKSLVSAVNEIDKG